MDDFILSVVEAKRIPGGVFTPIAGIKILLGVAREIPQAFYFVLDGVALHQIHDNRHAFLVCRVNQLLQFFGSAEARRRSKEAGHMIPEGTIIRMLLNGHDLDTIVSVFDNSRKHILAKLIVGPDFLGILRHSDVALVDE